MQFFLSIFICRWKNQWGHCMDTVYSQIEGWGLEEFSWGMWQRFLMYAPKYFRQEDELVKLLKTTFHGELKN